MKKPFLQLDTNEEGLNVMRIALSIERFCSIYPLVSEFNVELK